MTDETKKGAFAMSRVAVDKKATASIGRAVYTLPFFVAMATMALCHLLFPSVATADPKTLAWMAGIREASTLPAGFFAAMMTFYLSALVLHFYPDQIVKIRQENTLSVSLTMVAFGGIAGVFFYIYLFFPATETIKMMTQC